MMQKFTGKKITTFKERFIELCDSNIMSATSLADALHVSKQTISAWKIGTRSPKLPTIIAIADYFNVKVEWLMGFDVSKQETEEDTAAYEKQNNDEIRIVSGMMGKMTKDQQEQVVNVLRAMFANHPELLK